MSACINFESKQSILFFSFVGDISNFSHPQKLMRKTRIGLAICHISCWLSEETPARRWGCRAGGGRVRCWRWGLHTRADRIWWSLRSPAGSSGAAAPSGPSPSAPSRCRSSAGTLTVCTPGQTQTNRKDKQCSRNESKNPGMSQHYCTYGSLISKSMGSFMGFWLNPWSVVKTILGDFKCFLSRMNVPWYQD